MCTLLETYVAKETPQLAPIMISENHLKNAAMRTVGCRVELLTEALQYRVETFACGLRHL